MNTEEFRDRTMAAAGTFAEKARLVGRITKLKTEVARAREAQRRAYIELGKLYYEKTQETPDPDAAPTFADIQASREAIEGWEREIAELKKALGEDGRPEAEQAQEPEAPEAEEEEPEQAEGTE